MFAGQLLYTSWKNGNSNFRGYMVYAKSTDITASEEEEIISVMRYNAPTYLPITPTPEEIKTLFPENYAFFKLGSGRFCYARAGYLGKDYSGRYGNYLIHAYVTEDDESVNPLRIIGAPEFRTELSESELNAPAAPPPIPDGEVDFSADPVPVTEIISFFSDDNRRRVLKKLLSVCMSDSGKRIVFYEESENVFYWAFALSILLPREYAKKLYYATYTQSSSPLITLSFALPRNETNAFPGSYDPNTVEIYAGRPAEDEPAGDYITFVTDNFASDYPGVVLAVKKFDDDIKKYAVKDCDFLMAYRRFTEDDYRFVGDYETLKKLLDFAEKNDKEEYPALCAKAFAEFGTKARFCLYSQKVELYKRVFPFLKPVERENLIALFVKEAFAESATASPASAYEKVVADCPCDEISALKIFVKQSFIEYVASFADIRADYFIAAVWIDVYRKTSSELKGEAFTELKARYLGFVEKERRAAFVSILDKARKADPGMGVSLYVSVREIMPSLVSSGTAKLFDYLSLAFDAESYFCVLLCAISCRTELSDEYVEKYASFVAAHPEKKNSFIACSSKYPEAADFLSRVFVYEYSTSTVRDGAELIDEYRKSVLMSPVPDSVKAEMTTIFKGKVQSYISSLPPAKKIAEAAVMYSRIGGMVGRGELDGVRYDLINTVFSCGSIAEIEKNLPDKQMVYAVTSSAPDCFSSRVRLTAFLIEEGDLFRMAGSRDFNKRAVAVAEIERRVENGFCFASPENSNADIAAYTEMYFEDVLYAMYAVAADPRFSGTECDLVEKLIFPFVKEGEAFRRKIMDCLKKEPRVTADNMYIFFAYMFSAPNNFSFMLKSDIIVPYLESVNGGKRREILEITEKKFAGRPDLKRKLKDFSDEYERGHVGVVKKFFDLFKNNKGDSKK